MKRIQYNSPVILTFSILAVIIQVINAWFITHFSARYFAVGGAFSFGDPLDYFRLVSHVLGHGSWKHLMGNLTFILLLGPILEEKYGGGPIFIMILLTALFTGIINVAFFSTGLLGASGIVFMLIILASVVDFKKGSMPLTFILVAGIFIGDEVINALGKDNISQMAHIIGGVFGALFGFLFARPFKDK